MSTVIVQSGFGARSRLSRQAVAFATAAALLALAPAAAPAGAALLGSADSVRHGGPLGESAVIDPAVLATTTPTVRVVVTLTDGTAAAVTSAVRAVQAIGGRVGKALPLVDGFSAVLPVRSVPLLASTPDLKAITLDREIRFASAPDRSYASVTAASAFVQDTGAKSSWVAGRTGLGIGVAVIDTGVADMADLGRPGRPRP